MKQKKMYIKNHIINKTYYFNKKTSRLNLIHSMNSDFQENTNKNTFVSSSEEKDVENVINNTEKISHQKVRLREKLKYEKTKNGFLVIK